MKTEKKKPKIALNENKVDSVSGLTYKKLDRLYNRGVSQRKAGREENKRWHK